jgi:hypothetical protein
MARRTSQLSSADNVRSGLIHGLGGESPPDGSRSRILGVASVVLSPRSTLAIDEIQA